MIVADLDILAEDGSVLVEARGFTMRRAAEAGARRGPRPAPSADRADWLAADQGAALLVDLLRADVNGQVIVRRHRGGRPVAGNALSRPVTPVSAAPDRPLPGVVARPTPAPAPARRSAGDQLRTTWVSLLGVTDVKDEDNFFDLGGNSLTAIELIDRVKDLLGVELSITAVFDHPTLAALAAEVERVGAR
jgi:acyl carrier protein